jgi:N-acetylneuraminic acid mutarotase
MKKTITFLLSLLIGAITIQAQGIEGALAPAKNGGVKTHHKTIIKGDFHPAKSTILSEGFEDGIPSTWSKFSLGASSEWTWTTEQAHSGDGAAYHNDDDLECDDWLVSPQLTIDNSGYFFKAWQYNTYSSYYETHEIVVSTGSGDPNDGDFTNVLFEGSGPEEEWEEIVASLSAFEGQDIYIGFHYIGEYADQWSIDDVTVESAAMHDLGIEEITFLSTIKYFDNEAIVKIHNYASSLETDYQLSMSILDENSNTVYAETVDGISIAPTEDIIISMPEWNAEQTGEYSVTVSLLLSGDENPDNNELAGSIEVYEKGWIIVNDIESPVSEYLGSSAIDIQNRKFYCIGGNPDGNKMYILDYDELVWSEGADLPAHSALGGAAYANGKIYAHRGDGGGKSEPTSDFWIYDVATNTWNTAASSPEVLRWTKIIYNPTNNFVYTFGGRNSNSTLGSVFAYDIENNTWDEATSMPIAVFGASVVYQSEKVYVIGGYDENNVLLSEVQVGTFSESDPLEISWTTETANYPTAIYKAQASAFEENSIIVSGGTDVSTNVWTPIPDTYIYDIEQDTWTQMQDQPTSLLGGFEGLGLVNAGKDNEVNVLFNIGGYDGSSVFTSMQAFLGFSLTIPPVVDLEASVITDENDVELSWEFDGFPGFEHFNIYRSTDDVTYNMIDNTSSLEYLDVDLPIGHYYYYVTAVCDGEEGPASEIVEVDVLVGINNNASTSMLVYPNPVINRLYLSSTNNIKKILFYDVYGRVLKTVDTFTKSTPVDVDGMHGVYLLKVITDSTILNTKIIIK